ncbi:hypothetical protein JCM14076_08510 [Methylosoma difficile]
MLFLVTDSSGIHHDFGFAPKFGAVGIERLFGSGSVNPDGEDDPYYLGSSDYSKTIQITQDQYGKLMAFGSNPTDFGFSLRYNVLTNSCINFVWEALSVAGLTPSGFQGFYWPWENSLLVPIFVAGEDVSDLFEDFVTTAFDAVDGVASALSEAADALGDFFDRQLGQNTGNLVNVFNLERDIFVSFDQGLFGQPAYNGFTQSLSDWLVGSSSTLLPSFQNYNFGLNFNTPIGAFNDSQSTTYDTSTSIANLTPVLLDAGNSGLSVALLNARDSNGDGQLVGVETNSLILWSYVNEDGKLDTGEPQALSVLGIAVVSSDYGFYTRGNDVRPNEPLQPTLAAVATPASPQCAIARHKNIHHLLSCFLYILLANVYKKQHETKQAPANR